MIFFCRACSVITHFLICVSFEIYWPFSQFERLRCWLPHSWFSFASELEIYCSILFCFLVFLWKTWAFSVIYVFVCELGFFFSVTLLVLYPWHLDYYISWKSSLVRSVWSLKAFVSGCLLLSPGLKVYLLLFYWIVSVFL